jgi:hypothetical protein
MAQQEEDAELTRAARQSRMDEQNRGRSRSRDPTAREVAETQLLIGISASLTKNSIKRRRRK